MNWSAGKAKGYCGWVVPPQRTSLASSCSRAKMHTRIDGVDVAERPFPVSSKRCPAGTIRHTSRTMAVELSEKLFSNAAGWEAMKRGRAYLEQGQVLSSFWEEPLLRGL